MRKDYSPWFRLLSAGLALSMMATTTLEAQSSDDPARHPKYEVPYIYPTEEGIVDALQRVRSYYEKTAVRQIIDSESGRVITDFVSPNKNAVVPKGFALEWSYTHGVVLSAFDYIDNVLGDPAFFQNNVEFFNLVAKAAPYFKKQGLTGWHPLTRMGALDDCGAIGAAMIKTYRKTHDKAYLPIINSIADYISNGQCRLEDGTLCRHRPQYWSVWSDDMYMSVPFLINMATLTNDAKYYDDAVRQILQMAKYLYVPEMQLFDHGWNVTSGDYDPHFFWGRANGWVLMSMAEVLAVLPDDYPGRTEILHLYRSMVQKLANLQSGDGFWHNLLDKVDCYEETSCTAMFTFAIAKGINEGWISHVYGPVALAGWNALQTVILPNGQVDKTCEGTTFAHDNVYYYHRPATVYATHGYGVVLYAGAEMIRLLRNDKIEVQKAKPNAVNSTFHYRLKSEWEK